MNIDSTSLDLWERYQGTVTEQKGPILHGNKFPRLEYLDQSDLQVAELETASIPKRMRIS